MAHLHINQHLVTKSTGEALENLCPFSAIVYKKETGRLEIDAGCKMCKICVQNGPKDIITFVDGKVKTIHKNDWVGIAVYAEQTEGVIHNVTKELLGKAGELAAVTGQPVYALLMGSGMADAAKELLAYGADQVMVYDDPALRYFSMEPYVNLFSDFIEKYKPSSVLVGATNIGRSIAPRVAARFRTGLTADCTVLQMKENTDIVQIRPAFGGNIMAQIITPNSRPQFCTVRYKVFAAPAPIKNPKGTIEHIVVDQHLLKSSALRLSATEKPKETDISEAKVIVAVGRGVKGPALGMADELCAVLEGQMACTRPLVESGRFDSKRQIGLSGRTVHADLIIALGISGSVQFAAGMKGSACIIGVNTDKDAPIFDIAHYGFVGDAAEILPGLLALIKGEDAGVS